MAEYPLLPLPPAEPGEPPPAPRFPQGGPRLSPQRQGQRLGPRFERLQTVLASDEGGLSLRGDPSSIAPERALVFEVAGSISDFYQLVTRIQGLEFLADEEAEFDPDEDLFEVDTRRGREGQPREERRVGGRLYLAMPDVRALRELLRLWNLWHRERDLRHQGDARSSGEMGKPGGGPGATLRSPRARTAFRTARQHRASSGIRVSRRRGNVSCTPHRATLLGYGTISAKEAKVHRIPLPPSLEGITEPRKVTVTVAWLSPVNPRHQSYRRAKLEAGAVTNLEAAAGVKRSSGQPPHASASRGAVFHDRYEGKNAVSFVDDGHVFLRIFCREQAGALDQPIRYGVAVTIEAGEGIAVYDEIRTRLGVPITPPAS